MMSIGPEKVMEYILRQLSDCCHLPQFNGYQILVIWRVFSINMAISLDHKKRKAHWSRNYIKHRRRT